MGKNIENNRPTSPHLDIYKWNICSLTSILHRFSGVVLYASILIISWYIVAFTYNYDLAATSPKCDCALWKAFECVTFLAVIALIIAISYHFSNGIRHLFWDIGKGFEIDRAKFTGYLVLAMTVLIAGTVLGFLYYYRYL